MSDTGTAEPPEVTDDTAADIETVAALLSPHFAGKFSLSPGERHGDVVVRPASTGDHRLVQQSAATLREARIRVRQEDDHVVAQLWPYDADRRDPLVRLRIPVTSAYPRCRYEVALCIGELWHDPPERPTDAEALMIASFLDYRRSAFRGGWQAKMLEKPFDLGGSSVTIVLLKLGGDDWCYRMDSWRSGPEFVPQRYGDRDPKLSLAALLDRIVTHDGVIKAPDWLDWKAAHPEAFGEVPDGN